MVTRFGVDLADMLIRWAEVDARRFQRFVADLLLDDRQRQLEHMDVMHDVAMTERVHGQLVQGSASTVAAVLAIQTGEVDVAREDLTDAIFGVPALWVRAGMKQKIVWMK